MNIPIISYVGKLDEIEYALTQEVVSEDTLAELEKRLQDVIDKAPTVDLVEINEKLKVLGDSIKLRYGTTEQPETGHLEEGGGMRAGAGQDIRGPPEDRTVDHS